MSRLSDMWSKIARSQNDYDAYVEIPAAQNLDAPVDAAARVFVPHKTYFELRLKQMFLRDRREYAKEYVPLSSFNVEFLFAGERTEAPLVVGPSLLANAEQLSHGERIEFLNTRLVGPCPYEGDDVELFAGLFRVTSNDWAKRALSLLEVLAKTFDTSKLSSTLSLAAPLHAGIEGFMGMKDVELRLGKHVSYSAPAPGMRGGGAIGPKTLALLRTPRSQLGAEAQRRFWVKEGRLFHGDHPDRLVEYDACDFLLLELLPLRSRSDFTSFDFHRKHWLEIERLLAEQRNREARAKFKVLAVNLTQCDDIVRAHRFALLEQYKRVMDDTIARYAALFEDEDDSADYEPVRGSRPKSLSARHDAVRSASPPATPAALESAAPKPAPGAGGLGEAELAAAVAQVSRGQVLSPDQMLAQLDSL